MSAEQTEIDADIDGTPCEQSVVIIRFVSHSTDGFEPGSDYPPLSAFQLNKNDKLSPVPHLSVWDVQKTTIEQGRSRLPDSKTYRGYDCQVGTIRRLEFRAEPTLEYDVQIFVPNNDRAPGYEGHCGIVGLLRPEGYPKRKFKQWRALLMHRFTKCWCELEERNHPKPHNLDGNPSTSSTNS